jgi:hypothetical protein
MTITAFHVTEISAMFRVPNLVPKLVLGSILKQITIILNDTISVSIYFLEKFKNLKAYRMNVNRNCKYVYCCLYSLYWLSCSHDERLSQTFFSCTLCSFVQLSIERVPV